MEYTEYEMYENYQSVVEVPSRDPLQIDFKKLDWWAAPTAHGFPIEFKFFDADVTVDAEGKKTIGEPRNYSKNYHVAEVVMTLDEYKKREEPKLAAYKEEKLSRFHAFTGEFFDGGLSLKRAFKAAIAPKKPVMQWYIEQVESKIAEATATGATHIALRHSDSLSSPTVVTDDMIVLDKKLNQLHPSAAKPAAPRPAPSPVG